jgi:uncharacterized membrane protein (DUF485 family)
LETKWNKTLFNGSRRPELPEAGHDALRYGWMLTWAVMIVYYGFTLLNAFDKEFMASRSAPA